MELVPQEARLLHVVMAVSLLPVLHLILSLHDLDMTFLSSW